MPTNINFYSYQYSRMDKVRRFFKRGFSWCKRGFRNKRCAVISGNKITNEYNLKPRRNVVPSSMDENENFRSYKLGRYQLTSRKVGDKTYTTISTNSLDSDKMTDHLSTVTQSFDFKISVMESQLVEINNHLTKESKVETESQNNEAVDVTVLYCPICSELLIKPVVLNCSHLFCKWCFENRKSPRNRCPECDQEITVYSSCYLAQELVNNVLKNTSDETIHEYKLIEYSRALLDEKAQKTLEKKISPRPKVKKTDGLNSGWF